MYTADGYDVEGGGGYMADGSGLLYAAADASSFPLDEKTAREIRFGFIRKVYSIIGVQLAVTLCTALFFVFCGPFSPNILSPLLLLGAVGSVVVLLVLACSRDLSRRYPHNYILLALFTLLESLTVGIIASLYNPVLVLQALLATIVIVGGLTFFVWQTDYDFTSWLGVTSFLFWGVIAVGLLRVLFWRSLWTQILCCVAFALFYGIYILIDSHLLIKRGRVSFGEDAYVFAAISLYIDIIGLFLELLRLLALFNRDRD